MLYQPNVTNSKIAISPFFKILTGKKRHWHFSFSSRLLGNVLQLGSDNSANKLLITFKFLYLYYCQPSTFKYVYSSRVNSTNSILCNKYISKKFIYFEVTWCCQRSLFVSKKRCSRVPLKPFKKLLEDEKKVTFINMFQRMKNSKEEKLF